MQICNSCSEFRAGTCLDIELECGHGLLQGKECWLKEQGAFCSWNENSCSIGAPEGELTALGLGIGCELGYSLTSSEMENELGCELAVLLPG